MTSSPSETIAKAGAQTPMAEHIERARAYMARGARMTLDAIPNDGSMSRYGFGPDVTLAISELLSLALQLEATQREMAEKDERIAALETGMTPFADEAACYDPDTGDNDDSVWATPAYFKIRDLRRARTLIQGEPTKVIAIPKPCGLPDPSYHDCENMKEVGGGMDGERYRCDVCGKGYFLDYEEMK